jgi:hypothetical protein
MRPGAAGTVVAAGATVVAGAAVLGAAAVVGGVGAGVGVQGRVVVTGRVLGRRSESSGPESSGPESSGSDASGARDRPVVVATPGVGAAVGAGMVMTVVLPRGRVVGAGAEQSCPSAGAAVVAPSAARREAICVDVRPDRPGAQP